MTETVQCTLCAKEESPGFYTGCMVKDGHAPDWDCDNGNLTRREQTMTDQILIEIDIENGFVQAVKAPAGVAVKINDYDIDGFAQEAKQDSNGADFIEQVVEGTGAWIELE